MIDRQGVPSCSGRQCTPFAAGALRTNGARRMPYTSMRTSVMMSDSFSKAGPETPAPSYESIDSQPLNRAIMSLFRQKMVAAIDENSDKEG